MGLSILFIATFASIGLVVSMIAGFMAGNRVSYILFVSLVSSLSFAGLGFGIYQILEKKVPEFLNFLSTLTGGTSESNDENEGFADSGAEVHTRSTELDSGTDFTESSMEDIQEKDKILQQAKSGKFGDHLVVDKIAIKNEPKLMAEAIRTIMSRDDDN